jgi:Nucleotide modification associated domain 2
MPRLFSYCIPYDDGAAPNPYWSVCTLAICKPTIRRVAEVGDWIAGTGSTGSPIGNIAGALVYAMRVERTMSMEEYDELTRRELPLKIPAPHSRDFRRRVGDSIYDFSAPGVPQRGLVHNESNRETDMRGENVLASEHFYYFGDQPVRLPSRLSPIVKQGQGHRSNANDPFLVDFVEWIEGLGYGPGTVLSRPQMWRTHPPGSDACATGRRDEATADLDEESAGST